MNLARSWRPKTFDEIVGQELTIRILKNSLYRNQLFPVYLLSGQRGSGKTTTGRVFAAAINCERRADFTRDPQGIILPCLSCQSCRAMAAGSHPDFIEIDAASHTGVDNVRTLIESSSYMPLMGTQKIYLIDEAHMLSKAAFNAFLKILEEPSAHVLFMLATTDAHKVIDTVKSRCFQLFFDPLTVAVLIKHLEAICVQENITYDLQGLTLVAQKSEGSVRDAINTLERIRLATSSLTVSAVTSVLGVVDSQYIIHIIQQVVTGKLPVLLEIIQNKRFKEYAASDMYDQLRAVIRECIWQSQGLSQGLAEYADSIMPLAKQVSVQQWVAYWQLLYDKEIAFTKASAQHDILQLIIIKMTTLQTRTSDVSVAPVSIDPKPPVKAPEVPVVSSTPWDAFLHVLATGNPLLLSLFKQGKAHLHGDIVRVEFPHKLQFFKEKFTETSTQWLPLLQKSYGKPVTCEPVFMTEGPVVSAPEVKRPVPSTLTKELVMTKKIYTGETVDMITRVFPGTIEEIKES